MTDGDPLDAGRAALSAGAWMQARTSFEHALDAEPTPESFEGLSWAAWWLDDVEGCLDGRERAYRLYREQGDLCGAARMALYLGDDHLEFRGERAVANGWFQRAARILEDLEPCPEQGWLAAFRAHDAVEANEFADARRLAAQARELGLRFGVVCLEMFSLGLEGLAMVGEGAVPDGMALLDEAAAAALGGEYEELAPASWTCCGLISACERVRDYDRAAQWCAKVEEFSGRMNIRFVNGVCRAHYAAVLTWHGRWPEAEHELLGALGQLTERRPFWRSEAIVRLADLRRRQGRFEEARELFAQADGNSLAALGLAELDLETGELAPARESLARQLRRLPAESTTRRAVPLELMVRADAKAGARAAAAAALDELRSIAADAPTVPLRAALCVSEAHVAEAAGDHDAARDGLEEAIELLAAAGAPYELGRTRLDLARVLVKLGRENAAAREASVALRRLQEIGAGHQTACARELLAELAGAAAGREPGGEDALTTRQLEVVRLVAEGHSDREIAALLTLSEHTVHRHVANIYARLGCSSRAAAVTHANRLGLLR